MPARTRAAPGLVEGQVLNGIAAHLDPPDLVALARTSRAVFRNLQVVLQLASLQDACSTQCVSMREHRGAGARTRTPWADVSAHAQHSCSAAVARASLATGFDVCAPAQPQEATVRHLALLLPVFCGIRCLRLEGVALNSSEVVQVVEPMQWLVKLTNLSIIGACMGQAGAATLACTLPNLSQLEALDLSSSQLGGAGLVTLAPSLRSLTELRHLSLANNGLGPEEVPELALIILPPPGSPRPALRGLCLSQNRLISTTTTPQVLQSAVAPLLTALRACTNLQRLEIAETGVQNLFPHILAEHTGIEHLDVRCLKLSDIQAVPDRSVECFQGLSRLTHLACFQDMHSVLFGVSGLPGPQAVSALRAWVEGLRQLRDLGWPGIDSEAYAPKLARLSLLTQLRYSCYAQNEADHTELLCQVLWACRELEVVRVRLDHSDELPAELMQLSRLRSLCVSWSGDASIEEGGVLSTLTSLTELRLRPQVSSRNNHSAVLQAVQGMCALRVLELPQLHYSLGQQELCSAFERLQALRELALKFSRRWETVELPQLAVVSQLSALQGLELRLPGEVLVSEDGVGFRTITGAEVSSLVGVVQRLPRLRWLHVRVRRSSNLDQLLRVIQHPRLSSLRVTCYTSDSTGPNEVIPPMPTSVSTARPLTQHGPCGREPSVVRLPRLLSLSANNVRFATICELGALPRLTRLELQTLFSGWELSEAMLEWLGGLKTLRHVRVPGFSLEAQAISGMVGRRQLHATVTCCVESCAGALDPCEQHFVDLVDDHQVMV